MLRQLLLAALLAGGGAKVVEGYAKLSSQDTEQYITKFSFNPYTKGYINGTFTVDGRVDYFDNHPHKLMLCLYNDVDWPRFQNMLKRGSLCVERQQLATWSTKVHPDKLTEENKHHFSFSSRVTHMNIGRAHYWYAFLMDCYLEEYDAHPPKMLYELQLLNGLPFSPTSSHLPADENGMTSINAIALIAMLAYGFSYGLNIYHRWVSLQQGHLIVLLFMVAYTLQTASVVCELLHLRRYEQDGKGLRWRHTYLALDFGSGLLQSASELLISLLLIALGFGWTLGLQKVPLEGLIGKILAGLQSPAELLKGLRSPSLLLLLAISGLQIVLHAIGRSYEDDFGNFHDHEHWSGQLLIAIRVVLWILFSFALRRSMKAEANGEVLAFLWRLLLLGTIWFLCLPLLVVAAMLLPPYRRHQLVAGGSVLVQTAALALLSTLFLTRSNYYRISSLAHLGSVFEKGFGGAGRSKLAVD